MAESSVPRFIDETGEDAPVERRPAKKQRIKLLIDPYLLVIVAALLAIGLMMVWSTTFFFVPDQPYYYFFQQLRSMVIGIVLMFALSLVDYRILRRLAIPLMAVIVFLLVAVLLFGTDVFNARRSLFNGAIQPSEPAKLVVIIYMAAWLSSKQGKLRNITYGLLPFAVLVGIVGALIIREPDISTAALILLTSSIMFFLAGADWIQIGITFIVFIAAGAFVIANTSYAQIRLQSWLDLVRDPVQAQASHSQNVIIAFLNGGLTGVGLGGSYQKFYNLSVPHTDSIFAVIGEELGLLGAGVVVALFLIFMLRGFKVARNAPDTFGSLLAAGVTMSIIAEALYNIAVMAAAVPFAGVPLPFISFGGSSLVTVLAGVGLILSVSRGIERKASGEGTRRSIGKILDFSRWDRRGHLSRAGRR